MTVFDIGRVVKLKPLTPEIRTKYEQSVGLTQEMESYFTNGSCFIIENVTLLECDTIAYHLVNNDFMFLEESFY